MRSALALALALILSNAAAAQAAPKIASLNLCTDQLLLALADPAQIEGLSPYATDERESFAAAQARHFPVLSGAEEILVAHPDIVLTSLFDKRATRELLRQNGVRLAEFTLPTTIEEAKAQLTRMGEITGQRERASAQVAAIDAAASRARAARTEPSLRVLPVSRRGWVSGPDSLLGALLREAGLRNAAVELGVRDGGLVQLEAIIALRPDLLLVSNENGRAEDEGEALLLHPALEKFYPAAKRLVIPERLTVCGGPMLADALDRLVTELRRVRP